MEKGLQAPKPRESYSEMTHQENSLSEPLLLDQEGQTRAIKPSLFPFQKYIPWILHIILLTISLSMLIASRMNVDRVRDDGHDLYSPAREALRYEDAPTRINGSLDFQSIYRGPPNAELDAAWANIVEVGTMRLSSQELEEMDATYRESAAKFPESKGGGYMGDLEVFHELHCVNFIRQYTYAEYYKDKENSFSDDPGVLRLHVDHCIDLLRQKVMCDVDIGSYTYNWVEIQDGPWPNFNPRHQCKDFDAILRWSRDHQVQEYEAPMTKTAGAVVLPTPP